MGRRNRDGGSGHVPQIVMSPGPGDTMPNPYNRLLVTSIESKTVIRRFKWRVALLGRYDVIHVHWPEALLFSTNAMRSNLKRLLMRLLVLRLRLAHSVLVWTVHNESPHERLSRRDMSALLALTASAKARVHLNNASAAAPAFWSQGVRDVVIPHGIYPGPNGDDEPPQDDLLLFFGTIRPYKGVDRLMEAFVALPGSARLRVIGQPSSLLLADALAVLASGDQRVSTSFRYFTDHELDREILRAGGVVLPYSAMTNSGVALLALSRGRPILAPSVPAIVELQAEVGAQWVHTFEGAIGEVAIQRFLEAIKQPRVGSPDLSRRSWDIVGALHVKLYNEVLGGTA